MTELKRAKMYILAAGICFAIAGYHFYQAMRILGG